MTVAPAYAPLYAGRPYGVVALPFDPRDFATFRALLSAAALRSCDPARGQPLVVARARDRRARGSSALPAIARRTRTGRSTSSIPYSRCRRRSARPRRSWCPGRAPAPYRNGRRGPRPPATTRRSSTGDYAVLHVGASSPLKLWPAERWRALADAWKRRVCASCGARVRAKRRSSTRSMPSIAAAAHRGHAVACRRCGTCSRVRKLLVCPDTGIAHLGRVVGVPTVTLFGPGSARDLRAGRVLRGHAGPRGHRRSVSVPRPDDPVLSRSAVGAPLRAPVTAMRPGAVRARCAWRRSKLPAVMAAVERLTVITIARVLRQFATTTGAHRRRASRRLRIA